MKKVLVAVVAALLILMIFTMCACSYVSSTSFLTNSQLKSLLKEYGTDPIQAVVTLTFDKTDGGETKTIEVAITYDLLLSQTPIAVIRFIQLANEGFYENTLIDTYNSTNFYSVMGRYSVTSETDEDGKTTKKYYQNTSDRTFAGEFKSNGYKEPNGGYAKFSIFSLAMYHDGTSDGSSFNSANGTLILALANETLNSNNYAVFAQMKSITRTIKSKDNETGTVTNHTSVPSDVLTALKSTSKHSNTVYKDESDEKGTSVSMMSPEVVLHVEILGNYDWSKLPKIGR